MFNEMSSIQGDLLDDSLPDTKSTISQSSSKIDDLGEKIGGARKDTAQKGAKRAKTEKVVDENAGKPACFRRFHVFENVAIAAAADNGPWCIADRLKKSRFGGSYSLATRKTFPTKEAAQNSIPLLALAFNHRARLMGDGGGRAFKIFRSVTERKQVQVVAQSFATQIEAMTYMAANAEAILNTNTTYGEADLPIPEKYARLGPQWRNGDVQGQDFMSRFNLRGVEFGNWNNQEDRQLILNAAYDGLMDLADVLELPPAQLGLRGELALAFGARGQGLSSARAHFERQKVAINITKMKGAGSLAHEWAHGLDNLLAKLEGKASKEWQTDKDGTRCLAAERLDHAYMSHGKLASKSKTSPEMSTAFWNLMHALYTKPEVYKDDAEKASGHVQAAHNRLSEQIAVVRRNLCETQTWRKRNVDPATADQLTEFDLLAAQVLDGSCGVLELKYGLSEAKPTLRSAQQMRMTNPTLDLMDLIIKAVRGKSGFNADRSGLLDALRFPMSHLAARRATFASAQAGESKTKEVPTDFAMAATELDQGRGGDYWRTNHEMLARAFSAYVEDKLTALGRTSNYLNYAPEFALIVTSWGFVAPYPVGTERRKFNALFDKLFAVMRAEWSASGGGARV